ncbi:golgin subfamily A member 6-like protein 1 isoform X1 [Rhizophagus clarus]|uniref:Golgin subfamily A member 6-like protein 1 isoform X1 n=1 Tax=Rhizophagus clarus TaxID=94130 RepID=A0A8H3MB39_9GLOM|nr:golgin subfamily A member 6-like protein 1 isoform X1 [Rhizophagus clarus]
MSISLSKQAEVSPEEIDLFTGLDIKNNRQTPAQHQRVSSVPNSPEQTNHKWQISNQRMVNSITSFSMSGNLPEISLKSNPPAISTATTTQTSAFRFISDPVSKKLPKATEKIPFNNSAPHEKSQSSLNNFVFNHEDTLAFAVPNNGQKRPTLESQVQNLLISQRPVSTPLNSIKARSKTNKVSLEELAIDTESNSNMKRGIAITSILNSPPPLSKNIISKTESELSRLEKELQQIIDIQSNVFQRRNSIYEQLAENFGKVKSLEIDQINALSGEDYARADKLTHEIQEIHHKINNLCGVLPGLDQTLNELREKQAGYLKSKAETCRLLEKELKTKKNEHIETWKTYSADMDSLRTMETKQINATREEIGKARSEIVFNKGILSNNETELNEKIEDRCREEKSERETLSKKRENIHREIEELLLRVERLRAEEDNYSKQINEIDAKIENITNEYNPEKEELLREKNELDNKEQDIENKSRHVEEIENQLHSRLDYCKKQYESSQEELALLEKRIEEMGSMSKINREEANEVEKLIDHLRSRAQRDLDCEKEISENRVRMEECDIEVKKLTSKVMHDKQTYSNVQQDISTIDTQIPALEEQKKLAVAGRDFKSASRLANRIKDLQSTRDERTKFLETKCASLERDQEDLKMARKNLKEYNSRFIEVEKNIGSELFEELNESLLQLRSRYDVANQRNFHTLMSLLQNEIKGLENRIDQIKVRYGLSNSNIQSDILNKLQVTTRSKDSNESTTSIINNSTRLEELEAQLQEAVEREDYLLAEQLQTEIRSIQGLEMSNK